MREVSVIKRSAGSEIFDLGEVHPFVYYLRRGVVAISASSASREAIVALLQPADLLLSVTSMLSQEMRGVPEVPRSVHFDAARAERREPRTRAVVLSACEMERVGYDVLQDLMSCHAAWARAFLLNMALYALAQERRSQELLLPGEQRYRRWLDSSGDLASQVRQKDIASLLGLTPVGLSRIAKRVSEEHAAREGMRPDADGSFVPPGDPSRLSDGI